MKIMQHSCENEIQAASLRVTPARIAALKLFELAKEPLDAQFLIQHLQRKIFIDRVTVFRIINAFVENGLIRKVEFGEGKSRYERTNTTDHHHLICKQCGLIIDVADTVIPRIEKQLRGEYNFLIQSHMLEFFGVCSNCQK